MITDIRTPTAFAFTNTITGIVDCTSDPVTIVNVYDAVVTGNSYSGNTVTYLINTESTVYASVVFPGLIMTDLNPGMEIAIVSTLLVGHLPGRYIPNIGLNPPVLVKR